MIRKIVMGGLLTVATFGFFFGFYSYQQGIKKSLSEEISQQEPVIEAPVETGSEEEIKDKILVPKLSGLSSEEAAAILEEMKLVGVPSEEYTDLAEKGIVFYQRPIDGTEVTVGTEIIYSISAGPFGQSETEDETKVRMPSLLDKTQKDAETEIRSLNLYSKVRKEYSEDVAIGHVIGQEPRKDTMVDAGSTITLIVSLGEKPQDDPVKYKVPNVVGQSRNDAESLLKRNGYRVQIEEQEAEEAYVGKVLRQTPSGGSEVLEKGTVKLIIGKRKATPEPEEPPTEPQPPVSTGSN